MSDLKGNIPGLELNVGVAWYRREQCGRLLEIAADREVLEDTYDEWQGITEKAMDRLALRGLMPRKVDVDVEELLNWCRSHNRPVDSKARSAFVLERLKAG